MLYIHWLHWQSYTVSAEKHLCSLGKPKWSRSSLKENWTGRSLSFCQYISFTLDWGIKVIGCVLGKGFLKTSWPLHSSTEINEFGSMSRLIPKRLKSIVLAICWPLFNSLHSRRLQSRRNLGKKNQSSFRENKWSLVMTILTREFGCDRHRHLS